MSYHGEMELLEERAMILVYIESADPLPNLVNEIGKNPAFSTSDDLVINLMIRRRTRVPSCFDGWIMML